MVMQRRVFRLRLVPILHVFRQRFVRVFLCCPLTHTLRQRFVLGFLRLPFAHDLRKAVVVLRSASSFLTVVFANILYDITR
jgi:hypothetical protein